MTAQRQLSEAHKQKIAEAARRRWRGTEREAPELAALEAQLVPIRAERARRQAERDAAELARREAKAEAAQRRWSQGGTKHCVAPWNEPKPLIVRCAFCAWTAEGEPSEVIELQKQHRAEAHGIDNQAAYAIKRAHRKLTAVERQTDERQTAAEPAPDELPLCGCGCGARVKLPSSRFLRGHATRTRQGRALVSARFARRRELAERAETAATS